MTRARDYARFALPWLLLASALLPLVISGGLIYPYLVLKTLGFWALALLSLGAFAYLVLSGEPFHYGRLASRLTWLPLVLVALAYLTALSGLGFYHSFWSYYVRGDGLLTLTLSVASFYLLLITSDARFMRRLLITVAAVGSAVAIYGIGEWLVSGSSRVGSLLGNAEFFAGYLGLALFATLAASRSLAGGWRRAAYAGAALQVLAIVLSATRGTLVALALAFVVLLAYRAVTMRGRARSISAGVLALIVVCTGLFVALRSDLAQVPFAPIARLAQIGASDPDVASRLFIWQNMLGQIEKSPIVGYGAEHIDILFNRFYDPTQIEEEWFDRSHNAFLDYAAQYGVGGFALYLALIVTFGFAAWRYRRIDRFVGEALVLGVLVYAVQNFFVFDTISSWWLFLALMAVLMASSSQEPPRPLSWKSPWLGALIALVLAVCIIPACVLPLIANRDLFDAYYWQTGNPALSIKYMNAGLALGTYADVDYGYEAYAMYTGAQASTLSGSARLAAYQSAVSVLTKEYDAYPDDARTALYLATVINDAPPEATSVDTTLEQAAAARAIELSPKRAQPWYILVNLLISAANASPVGSVARATGYAQATSSLKAYELLVPTLAEPHFVLAELYLAEGDKTAASAEAALGKASYTSDLETARRAAAYYESVLDLPDAQFFLGEIVRLDPSDAGAASDLSQIEAYESAH